MFCKSLGVNNNKLTGVVLFVITCNSEVLCELIYPSLLVDKV